MNEEKKPGKKPGFKKKASVLLNMEREELEALDNMIQKQNFESLYKLKNDKEFPTLSKAKAKKKISGLLINRNKRIRNLIIDETNKFSVKK